MLLSSAQAAAGRVRVYRGVTVVDGTGAPRFTADVAIEGPRIAHVVRRSAVPAPAGPPAETPAPAEASAAASDLPADAAAAASALPPGAVEIDARGLVLAPGFIDMHAHSDLAVLRGADHTAKLLQGVTTEVIGQDGLGYAPLDDAAARVIPAQIAGWNGLPDAVPWRTMDDLLTAIDAATAANVAVLVPQGNLRMIAVGLEDRPATPDELATMTDLLGAALDAGAFGMSSGLTYTPGMYADTAELEALCRVVAERGGFWAPHTRSYGGGALDAYREALDIGRRTGCAIHLTHATMNFAANRGRAAELLALVDAAIADGVDVTLDTYPYLPGATTLAALLPSRLAAGGDLLGAIARLDEAGREALRVELEEVGCDGFHGERADWSAIEISGVASPRLERLVGRTIAEIAQADGRRAVDVVLDMILEDAGATGILMHIGDEANVRAIMRHPRHTGGSDGILVGGKPHPRGFGTFPHYLGRYVRELGVLGLEEAVRHLAGTPARRLGLDRGDAPRGVIRPGATADLVLFDAERIAAGATFDAPRTPPQGIVEVLVAGVPVVADGAVTGRTPGRALRMPPPAHRATVPELACAIDPLADAFRLAAETPVVAGEGTDAAADLAGRTLGLAPTPDPALPPIRLEVDPALAGEPGEPVTRTGGEPRTPGRGADPRTPAGGGSRTRTGGDPRTPGGGTDEAFRIEVAASGVRVRGASATGVLRGVMALRQLCEPERAVGTRLPAGTWWGAPAFGWRGVMLDVARHFRPVDDIRRLIDLLALHHLDVLHLHLTDDQGWRFEVPGYPRLTTVGARRDATQRGHGPLATVEPGRHEGSYTSDDLRELSRYAADRGITLVPEVELPGHVQAALAAYPELGNLDAAEPATGPWERFGVNPRTLAPTDAALAFGFAAIDALCEAVDSPWIGIGGDEVPTTEWAASPAAAARMRELGLETPADIQPWFTAHFVERVRSHGRIALAWDEVLAGEVPDGVHILAWRGPVALQAAMRRGIPVIGCPDLEAYLDYRQSDGPDEPVPVGPPLTIERAYAFEPPDGVLGGQANVWTEHLDSRDRVDFAMFPRLAAIAERLWVGGPAGEFGAFRRRLEVHLRRLATQGVRYRPLDGPLPDQRRAGTPGKPITIEQREAIVADLVAGLAQAAGSGHGGGPAGGRDEE